MNFLVSVALESFPETKTLLLFIVASLTLLVVPGPAVLYVVARSLERGWRAGIVSAFGLSAGAVVHILLATIGVAALVQSSPVAFTVLRIGGALFLVFLGFRMITSAQQAPAGKTSDALRLRQVFAQGLIVNLSNPKAMLFFFAFLPQFVNPTRGAVPGQLLVLGGIFLVLAFVSDAAWAVLAGWFGAWANRRPALLTGQRYIAGSLLIALGVLAAVSGL